jgi:hypothetical protein
MLRLEEFDDEGHNGSTEEYVALVSRLKQPLSLRHKGSGGMNCLRGTVAQSGQATQALTSHIYYKIFKGKIVQTWLSSRPEPLYGMIFFHLDVLLVRPTATPPIIDVY